MSEFGYFFVVNFSTFFSPELNTLSENEPHGQWKCDLECIAPPTTILQASPSGTMGMPSAIKNE